MDKIINQTFSKRLQQARKMKGLSLEALSKNMDCSISKQAINKYEKGKMMPDSKILLSLASALDVKIDFFFRPYTVTIDKVEFRKKSKVSIRQTESIRERIHDSLERYLEIEQLHTAPKFDLKQKCVKNSEEASSFAIEIRSFLQLGNDGISNVIEVLEDHGIKIVEVDEKLSFDGLSGYANQHIPVIILNANLCSERKRFTALHELGHLLLNFPDNIEHKEEEKLCNIFANELLLPFTVLSAKLGRTRHDISLKELIDLQRLFGISVDAIMYSLNQHNVISESRYRHYNIKKNTDKPFKQKVLESRIPEEHSGRFFRMVYRALADERISISKAAVLLDTSVSNVKAQLQLV